MEHLKAELLRLEKDISNTRKVKMSSRDEEVLLICDIYY